MQERGIHTQVIFWTNKYYAGKEYRTCNI